MEKLFFYNLWARRNGKEYSKQPTSRLTLLLKNVCIIQGENDLNLTVLISLSIEYVIVSTFQLIVAVYPVGIVQFLFCFAVFCFYFPFSFLLLNFGPLRHRFGLLPETEKEMHQFYFLDNCFIKCFDEKVGEKYWIAG